MFFIHSTVLALVAGYAFGAPQQYANTGYSTPIPIVSQSQDGPNVDGSYNFGYQTGNGIQVQENGYIQNYGSGEPNEIQTAQGSYSYTGPDGQVYQVTYTADQNGFLAQGAHLPTPPPIPAAIQKALDFIASQPQEQYDDNGNPTGNFIQPNQQRYGK